MNSLKVVICTFIILGTGCQDKPQSIFPTSMSIKGEVLRLNYELKEPIKIEIADSILIVDDKNATTRLVLINMNQNIAVLAGVIGQGPNELLSCSSIDYDPKHKKVWVYDLVRKIFNVFDLDSTFKHSDYYPRQIAINPKNGIPTRCKIFDSKTFFATGFFASGILAKYSNVNDSTREFHFGQAQLPRINNKLSDIVLNQAYSYDITCNKVLKKIAIASQEADQLLIYDSLLNNICNIRTCGGYDPIFAVTVKDGCENISFSRKSRTGYTKICSTPNCIYALFAGKTNLETNGEEYSSNTVHVFDWDGKPIMVYRLSHQIISLAIDHADKYLYGISYEKEVPVILIFKL
jgi:hypothetical protein